MVPLGTTIFIMPPFSSFSHYPYKQCTTWSVRSSYLWGQRYKNCGTHRYSANQENTCPPFKNCKMSKMTYFDCNYVTQKVDNCDIENMSRKKFLDKYLWQIIDKKNMSRKRKWYQLYADSLYTWDYNKSWNMWFLGEPSRSISGEESPTHLYR